MNQVRTYRREAGWSQAQLADRAGVSRQLVSALESGRHEPGVAAALAIASVLGASVEALFGEAESTVHAVAVNGEPTPVGPVRVGLVRGRTVMDAVSPLAELDGAPSHGRWTGTTLERWEGTAAAGVVLAGCEPGLGVLAARLAPRTAALWVKASSAEARAALTAGRVHVAAVHDRADRIPERPADVAAVVMGRWRVGVAFDRSRVGSVAEAVEAGAAIVQRQRGAGTQAAFDRWVRRAHLDRPAGPRAAGHVEVCRLVGEGGATAGVTAEPAAVAAGLGFEALEEHEVQLWCSRDHADDAAVASVMEHVTSRAFAARLAALPAYDIAGLGSSVA